MQESKNVDYVKQHHTPHCCLPAIVMYPANSTKRYSWLTRSTSILVMKNVSDKQAKNVKYVKTNYLMFIKVSFKAIKHNYNLIITF